MLRWLVFVAPAEIVRLERFPGGNGFRMALDPHLFEVFAGVVAFLANVVIGDVSDLEAADSDEAEGLAAHVEDIALVAPLAEAAAHVFAAF